MTNQNDPFADLQEVKSEILPFCKIGDWIRGTLTNKNKAKSKFQEGRIDDVYEFKAQGGRVHTDEGQEINLVEGNFYVFWGKPQLASQMRNVKIGQIFGVRFRETKPSTKGNPQKLFTVAFGLMDESYQGETSADTEEIGIDESQTG